MGIYTWNDSGTHAYTRQIKRGEFEAIIDEPVGGADPVHAAQLVSALEQQGYHVTPMDVPQAPNHSITISGIKDAGVQTKLRQRLDRLGIGAQVASAGDAITVSGIGSQELVKETLRALESGGFTKEAGYTVTHTDNTPAPGKGIHVRGITSEEAFLTAVEKSGWSKGERRDEYYGMSSVRAAWSKMLRGGARRWAAAFFVLSDSLLGKFNWQEAQRTKGADENSVAAFVRQPNFGEFMGFFSGSFFLFMANPKHAPSAPVIGEHFKQAFHVGEGYDFSLSRNFASADISSGHIPDTFRAFAEANGHQILLTGGVVASRGIFGGRYRQIDKLVSAPVTGGASEFVQNVQNVVLTGTLDDQKRPHALDKRFNPQDWLSGILVGTGSALGIMVPQRGMEHPAFNYPNIVEKMRDKPVLGNLVGLAESFAQTTAGKALLYAPGKFIDWIRSDPFLITSKWFRAHNLAQIVGGAYGWTQIGKEKEALKVQFQDELKALDKGFLTPPAGQGEFRNLPIELSKVEPQDKREKLERGLREIYEGKPSAQNYIDNYVSTLQHRTATDPSVVDDVDRYLAVKALNRMVLGKREEEHSAFFTRLTAYSLAFVGNALAGLAGEGHADRPNYTEKTSSLFASCEELAKVLRENNAVNDTAIVNAGKFLYAQNAFRELGLSEKELAGIVGDYAHGRVPEQVQAKMAQWIGQPAVAQEAVIQEEPGRKFAREDLLAKKPEARPDTPEGRIATTLTPAGISA